MTPEENVGVDAPTTSRRNTLRRPDVQAAFDHVLGLGGEADLTHLTDPDQRGLHIAREYGIRRYGDIGPRMDLSGFVFEEADAGGVRAVWVTEETSKPTHRIVYVHGGGWRSGSPEDYLALGASLARYSGMAVLLVDYRLAPEHRYPAGLDDCTTAFTWAGENGPRGARGAAEVVFLAGDSAGGNLAAATCLRLAGTGARLPDRLTLIAPTLDNVEVDRRVGVDDPICPPEVLAVCTRMYLPNGHDPADPFVSPVYAPRELLESLPPTLIQVSSIEALLWDSTLFAGRLQNADVRVDLSVWPRLPHVWHQFLGHLPEAAEALKEMSDHFRRAATPDAVV